MSFLSVIFTILICYFPVYFVCFQFFILLDFVNVLFLHGIFPSFYFCQVFVWYGFIFIFIFCQVFIFVSFILKVFL